LYSVESTIIFCLRWRHCDEKCWREEIRKYRNAGNCSFEYFQNFLIKLCVVISK